jgi:hypothetical protein
MSGPQSIVFESERGRVVAVDSAYDTRADNRERDVVVNASYSGVLPARFVGRHRPRGAIGVDCGIGPDGAGIAGLWYLEALGVPAATADIATVRLGDGVDMYETSVISRVNAVAARCGVVPGMTVRDAARRLLATDPPQIDPSEVTNREIMETGPHGRQIVCTDSIAFGLPEDRGRNVLCTAGLALVEVDGLAGATVDARTARMGDGHSTYADGVISAVNVHAALRGVEVGQPAREAALRLLADLP